MSIISSGQIETFERFYRANFINSLSGFKPVSLIGTANASGQTNLAVFSNIFHIGADPALVGYINRPRQAAPHTIANIEATRIYTINHIQKEQIVKAHMTSAKYPDHISEFESVGFTPEYIDGISAPFVKESMLKFALKLRDIIPISFNDTSLVIGEIITVSIDDELISKDGFIDLEKAGSVCSSGIDAYYEVHKLNRYAYAKPFIEPLIIP